MTARAIQNYPLSILPPLPSSPIDQLKHMLTRNRADRKELLQVARKFYGDPLCDLVCDKAELGLFWPDRVCGRHIRILLAALGHAVTLSDLDTFLAKKFPISHLLPPVSASKATDLSAEDLDAWMSLLRSPEKLFGSTHSFWEELQPDFRLITGPERRCMAMTRQDYIARQILLHGQPESPSFAFATGEFLAKLAAYTKPETVRKGLLLPVYANRKIAYYGLHQHLHDSGLHAYFYVPLHDLTAPALFLFRGTNGIASLKRSCLDPRGIGKEVFDKNQDTLLFWLTEYASKIKTPSLRICGHSLGGTDAQRMLASIVGKLAKENDSPLNRFTHIQMSAYCAPKLDQKTVLQWKRNREQFKKLEKKPTIKIERVEHESDPLAWAGDFALYDEGNEVCLDSSLMIVRSEQRFPNPHQAHSLSFFNPRGDFDSQGDLRTFILIDPHKIHTVEEVSLWDEVEEQEWLLVLERVKSLAKKFEKDQELWALVQKSEKGLRQRSPTVQGMSNYVVSPLVFTINRLIQIFQTSASS